MRWWAETFLPFTCFLAGVGLLVFVVVNFPRYRNPDRRPAQRGFEVLQGEQRRP